jgi:polyferredoxin
MKPMSVNNAETKVMKRSSKSANYWPRIRLAFTLMIFALIAISFTGGTVCYAGTKDLGVACPFGVVQIAASSIKIPFTLLISGFLGLGVILLFGRAFCSWICPGRWIFNRLAKPGQLTYKFRSWIQVGLVGSVFFLSWICKFPIFCTICPAGLICRGELSVKANSNLSPVIGWMGLIVGAEWLSGLSWCRDLCPLGAGISLVSRFNPFLKVKTDPQKCVPCKACERACPEGLNLSADTDFSRCTKCFTCQSACPRGAVQIKLH